MSILEVPGAHLHFEISGKGPLLVLVPGASGGGDPYRNVGHELAARYRVLRYDRRGYSRSRLHGPQDYGRRLETDADDVQRLIDAAGADRAIVFGNSSGALVALELLTRHPDCVDRVIAHEPPAVHLLPDGQRWVEFFHNVYDTYRRSGVHPALEQFGEAVANPAERAAMARARDPNISSQIAADVLYWFERELRQYPAATVDVDTLVAHADRIVLAGGRDSRQHLPYQPNTVLAARLGQDIVDLPGGHVGVLTHPVEFARALMDALEP